MQIWVQRLAGRRWELEVPEGVEVAALRQLVASAGGLPVERLKLVLGGKPLQDGNRPPALKADDTVVAVVAPLAPTAELSRMAAGSSALADEDEDDMERFRLRPDAGPLERRLAAYLQHQLKLPPLALSAIFLLRPAMYLYFLLWLALCPLAAKLEVGPVYVLGTMIAIIYVNLGKRQAGEASAYSIYNQGRELPGQLNAGAIDDQMRRGQM